MKIKKGKLSRPVSILLACIMAFVLWGCTGTTKIMADDLMKGITAASVNGKAVNGTFEKSMADFSVELFKKSVSDKDNSLISPLSVMLALAMTANGADGITLQQMETVLGGEIPLDELNEYLYSYVKGLPNENKSELSIANSIWFRDDESFIVEKDFLQTNADYYGAAAYKSAFDGQTVKDINNWVKKNTKNMIDKIIENIDSDTIMYLINALAFEAEWKVIYEKSSVRKSGFTAFDGSVKQTDFMFSTEGKYISDGMAEGFIKPYYNNKYSFAALLPNEEIGITDYINSLNGESFINMLKNAGNAGIRAGLPKFSYEYKITMNDVLKDMGMTYAFNRAAADFSRLGNSAMENIYIGKVLHKTFIAVDEKGTKAGAVTSIEMIPASAGPEYDYIINLDRPFVYAIIDNATSLPVFIGAVMNV